MNKNNLGWWPEEEHQEYNYLRFKYVFTDLNDMLNYTPEVLKPLIADYYKDLIAAYGNMFVDGQNQLQCKSLFNLALRNLSGEYLKRLELNGIDLKDFISTINSATQNATNDNYLYNDQIADSVEGDVNKYKNGGNSAEAKVNSNTSNYDIIKIKEYLILGLNASDWLITKLINKICAPFQPNKSDWLNINWQGDM